MQYLVITQHFVIILCHDRLVHLLARQVIHPEVEISNPKHIAGEQTPPMKTYSCIMNNVSILKLHKSSHPKTHGWNA